ncbi:hypothetical protein BHE74_00031014 [Ensete ventricosum]|nr:hypothetical protein BHE74_00031014 [Ensete ventricosum]
MNRKLQSIASCSVRIGNELGAAHPRVAKFAVIVVVTTSLIISLFVSVLVMLLRTPLSKLYTNSTDVIKAVINLTPLLAISIFLNGVQPILSEFLLPSASPPTQTAVAPPSRTEKAGFWPSISQLKRKKKYKYCELETADDITIYRP